MQTGVYSMTNLKVALLYTADSLGNKEPGGMNNYFHGLYEGMVEHENKGFEVTCIQTPKRFMGMGAGVAFFKSNLLRSFKEYDIIHNPGPDLLYAMRKDGTTQVATMHSLNPILYPKTQPEVRHFGLKTRLWYELVVKNTYRLALWSDFIIARSTKVMNECEQLGYPKERMMLVTDSIKDKYIREPKHGMEPHKFRIGYIGGLGENKNVIMAVRALSTIKDSDIEFRIYGLPGQMYPELQDAIGKDKRIRYMGLAPEDRMVSIYDSFDVFVFPTISEGFGIPIIEAQARGLPVIVMKGASMAEEVSRHCLEARDESEMASLFVKLKQNGYSDSSRKASTEYARRFTWKAQIQNTLKAYRTARGLA